MGLSVGAWSFCTWGFSSQIQSPLLDAIRVVFFFFTGAVPLSFFVWFGVFGLFGFVVCLPCASDRRLAGCMSFSLLFVLLFPPVWFSVSVSGAGYSAGELLKAPVPNEP